MSGRKGQGKGRPEWSDWDYIRKLVEGSTRDYSTGCWIYTQGWERKFKVDNGTPGYREMSYRGKNTTAHRVAWMVFNEQAIPAGQVILHKCDNPPCVNPMHLILGTRAENNKDMKAKGRYNYHRSHYTKCRSGHEFTPENTRYTKQGARACITCQRAAQRKRAGWPAWALYLAPVPKGQRPTFLTPVTSASVTEPK